MKALLRSAPVQAVLTAATWAYLGLVAWTVRWTRQDQDLIDKELALERGAIGCMWHGTIPMAIAARAAAKGRRVRVLISLSPDGEFITRAIAGHGIQAIRGSAAKKADTGAVKAKGGAAALRECLDWLAEGGLLLVTPDGPRGPARRFSAGVARMARMSGAPVYMLGLAASPAAELKSWDRTQLPRPFGRGVVAWNGPFYAVADLSEDDLTGLCQTWAGELDGACERAKAALT